MLGKIGRWGVLGGLVSFLLAIILTAVFVKDSTNSFLWLMLAGFYIFPAIVFGVIAILVDKYYFAPKRLAAARAAATAPLPNYNIVEPVQYDGPLPDNRRERLYHIAGASFVALVVAKPLMSADLNIIGWLIMGPLYLVMAIAPLALFWSLLIAIFSAETNREKFILLGVLVGALIALSSIWSTGL